MSENTYFRRVGVTPPLLELAWRYALKGVGEHYVAHRKFDNVVVEELYEWKVVHGTGQGGIRVNFRKGTTLIKYVELSCKIAGGGGDPVVRYVTEAT